MGNLVVAVARSLHGKCVFVNRRVGDTVGFDVLARSGPWPVPALGIWAIRWWLF